jgi:hypothetical protein
MRPAYLADGWLDRELAATLIARVCGAYGVKVGAKTLMASRETEGVSRA